VYADWEVAADQRAAVTMAGIMPSPVVVPRGPHEVIGAELREQVESGQLPPGSLLPTVVDLAASTAWLLAPSIARSRFSANLA
jgi:Bacterial regulatory proteins, gntR family